MFNFSFFSAPLKVLKVLKVQLRMPRKSWTWAPFLNKQRWSLGRQSINQLAAWHYSAKNCLQFEDDLKNFLHVILMQNIKRGTDVNQFCPPNSRDDLCLLFSINPSALIPQFPVGQCDNCKDKNGKIICMYYILITDREGRP